MRSALKGRLHFSLILVALTALLLAPWRPLSHSASVAAAMTTDTTPQLLRVRNFRCGTPLPNRSHCFSERVTDATIAAVAKTIDPQISSTSLTSSIAAGLAPVDLWDAYAIKNVVFSHGSGSLVAIVDAYDDVFADYDLAKYRAKFHLGNCRAATGCLRIIHQDGSAVSQRAPNFVDPSKNPSSTIAQGDWIMETSLDLDMVSANCPRCKILVVTAKDDSPLNLALATDKAASYKPVVISHSYGIAETNQRVSQLQSHYRHPGIVMTASNGDYGYQKEALLPVAFQNVVAVGGTVLTKQTTIAVVGGRKWTEKVWSSSGGGCSSFVTKPAWQRDSGCARRTIGDVSYAALGLIVYDSDADVDNPLILVNGTSAGAPAIAGIIALAGNAMIDPSYIYARKTHLNRISSGSTGSCAPEYLCAAGVDYSGPAGYGTPNGFEAF